MKPRMCCIEPSGALRLLLIEIAQKAGWEIDACKSLEEAQEVFGATGSRLDLVVTTATLPSGGFSDVIACLRSRAETETTPIVLLTSDTDSTHAEKALENGITEVFFKDNLDTLQIYLASFFDDQAHNLSGKRVLILDDDHAVSEYLRAVLIELDLAVDLFHATDEALGEALVTAYDLVITDLVLDRNQSGVNFIRLLRQSGGKSAAAPVIAISGYDDDARRLEALRAGVGAFLAKPIVPAELCFQVRRLLQRAPVDSSTAAKLGGRSHQHPVAGLPADQIISDAQAAVMDWLLLAAHVMNEIRQGVMVTNEHGVILQVNPAFTQITGFTSEDALGKTPAILRSGRHPPAFYRNMFETLATKGAWSGEIWNRGKAGNIFVEWLDIRRLPPGMPMGAYYVGVIANISLQQKQIEHLRNRLDAGIDLAMHQVKKAGGQGARCLDYTLNGSSEASSPEDRLHKALSQSEFELMFQPRVDLVQRKIRGAEALLRWRDPERGLLAANSFIPLAEKTGLIVQLGNWALHEACAMLRRMHDAGHLDFIMSVNVSQLQIVQGERFIDDVRAALATSGASPYALQLEITEAVFIRDPEHVAEIMHKLVSLGISLALDNFGVGYFSPGYLRHLPFRALKIDRRCISDAYEDPYNNSIVKSCLLLADSLGMQTVAEGVETCQQETYLENIGCRLAQGNLLGRPMSADQILLLLNATIDFCKFPAI